MELTLPQTKELMKQHKISGRSYLNKAEMITRLIEKGVLTRGDLRKEKSYDRLKRIRKHPKRVEILDKETGTTTTYRSIYSAAKHSTKTRVSFRCLTGKYIKKDTKLKCVRAMWRRVRAVTRKI